MKNRLTLSALLLAFTSWSQCLVQPHSASEFVHSSRQIEWVANPLTQNYDVLHQRLALELDPTMHYVQGAVTTQLRLLSATSVVYMDMYAGLQVDQLFVNGLPIAPSQPNANDVLAIDLGEVFAEGEQVEIRIDYQGAPNTNEDAFVIATYFDEPVLWTLSEPFGAKDWWPCKQDLNDKINGIEVQITVPTNYTAVSNGTQISRIDLGDGRHTFTYQHNYPIPAYLVAVAVADYTLYTQTVSTGENPLPIYNYFYSSTAHWMVPQVQVTPAIMQLYESYFGEYPYRNEHYGHAQTTFGGGMEHTTMSFMGGFSRELIAHELAHQWFGNKLTCGSWNDIWLNEGFATYLSGMVVNALDGPEAFENWRANLIENITSQPGGNLYLTDEQAQNSNRIFSGRLTYNKGAMVVHMLRYIMGDEAFFTALYNYLHDPDLAYAYAVTEQLQAKLEAEYGQSLDAFFADWIYGEGYPIYSVHAQGAGSTSAWVTINQSTSTATVDFFEMPLELDFIGVNNERFTVQLNVVHNAQNFAVDVPFEWTNVLVDPRQHIIHRDASVTLGNDVFAVQELKLVPNPAQEVAYLHYPAYWGEPTYTVMDLSGRRLFSHSGAEVQLQGLATGQYWLHVQFGEQKRVLPILKN